MILFCIGLVLVAVDSFAIRKFPSKFQFHSGESSSRRSLADSIETMTTTVDSDLWDAYENNLLDVKDRIRLGKKDRTVDLDQVIDLLRSKEVIVSSPEVKEGGGDSSFGQRMEEQKEMFLAKSNLTTAQHNFAVRMLTYAGDLCAKRQDPTAIVVAWEKIKEWGIVPRENGVSTYLYAFGLREDLSDLTNQVATFHDLLFEPNEKTIALRVKHLIHQEDAPGAEALLQSLPVSLTVVCWNNVRPFCAGNASSANT